MIKTERTASELAKICNGRLINCDESIKISIFVNNDKDVVNNCVYVAINGERHNGIDIAEKAVKGGASLILCDEMPKIDLPTLLVGDIYMALADISAYYRKKELASVVAVTGSVGKTTTKELLSSLILQKHKVLKTEGNKNNLLGMPLTVLSNTESEIAVLEAGISEIGEMEILSKIASPNVAVITGIGLMHAETLGSRKKIAEEKLKILTHAQSDAVLIIPENEPLLAFSGAKNTVTVAIESDTADYSAYNIRFDESGTHFDLKKRGKLYLNGLFVPIIGNHGVYDATLSIAAAELYGIDEKGIRSGLAEYKAAENRQNIIIKNGVIIMADCYNFGPESARASLEAFDMLAKKRGVQKRVLCLGSMLELGMISESEHIALGKAVAGYGFDALITVGELAKNIALGAHIGGMPLEKMYIYSENEREEAGKTLSMLATKGTAVLIKGSRKMKMEEFIPLIG